jgi:hypothetical protein
MVHVTVINLDVRLAKIRTKIEKDAQFQNMCVQFDACKSGSL